MFTGIIEEIGTVIKVMRIGNGMELTISSNNIIQDIKLGDSIAVNGICLTVESITDHSFGVTCSAATLGKSNIGMLRVGCQVNLERALTPSSRVGGHFVQGHVDCTGRISGIIDGYPSKKLKLRVPVKYMKFSPQGGSIAINGVSLTIAGVKNSELEINLVPHTLKNINMKALSPGSKVNVEFDCLAKYVESVLLKEGIYR